MKSELVFSVSRIGENPMDTEEYKLERQATALKKSGDLNGAIECLRKASALRGPGGGTTRLAKFLQLAGRFDEAMDEIKALLGDGKEWAACMFGHQPPKLQWLHMAARAARIHRDAALICKREKNEKLRLRHEIAADLYAEKSKNLDEVSREISANRRQAWEIATANGPEAVAEFLIKRQNGEV